MPLFRILLDKKIENVKRVHFNKEKELQELVEKNMSKFFGLEFLETEYPIPNGRIDSLCIDESQTPVIIEYKKHKDLSAIIQGLFYVDWLKVNKRTFEMIVREKLGNNSAVDWKSTPRLLIIAEDFDQKETSAINQINANVELIKYSYYGDLISFEQLNFTKPQITYSNQSRIQSRSVKKSTESTEEFSLESVLYRGNDRINNILKNLRDWILDISDDIDERVKSSMVSYYSSGKGLIWIESHNRRFTIHLRKGEYKDYKNLLKNEGWGGYPVLHVKDNQYNAEVEKYIKETILQAYDY
ncbi:endonuclease NucS domain-containing protein [Maribellus mangrovi]|uniref:endonuclease NucS domain-containing protein n=1 Tax=Maribellus mangrovi TaxID=3133146 RepID=UPI0030EF2B50